MLPGVMIKPLRRSFDERGSFMEVIRADWGDLIGDDRILQANLSMTYPGIVRAWHRHERGQVDYFVAVRGALKICAYGPALGPELLELIEAFRLELRIADSERLVHQEYIRIRFNGDGEAQPHLHPG